MTIDEAISHAREVAEKKRRKAKLSPKDSFNVHIKSDCLQCAQEHEQLAKWLEELQQYRAIGTPEELKAAMKYVYLAKKHGTVGQVIENCVKYEEIGTPEECRAAVERNNEKTRIIDGVTECCGYDFGIDAFQMGLSKFCPVCGKKIERNGEE